MADNFSVENHGDYIYLRTWGHLENENLEKPADTALEMGKKTGITKLLDNIQEVDSTVSLPVQLEGVKVLWKLRAFKKIAIVIKDNELGHIFFSSLAALHLSEAFRGFTDEAEAIAWLKADANATPPPSGQ